MVDVLLMSWKLLVLVNAAVVALVLVPYQGVLVCLRLFSSKSVVVMKMTLCWSVVVCWMTVD